MATPKMGITSFVGKLDKHRRLTLNWKETTPLRRPAT
jgi:hypothetical protein